MNEDHAWLCQQDEHLSDEIHRCHHSFMELQEHRKEIAALWCDACARELNGRFLNPMTEEASASLEGLRDQCDALSQCAARLTEAYRAFSESADASRSVQRLLEDSAAMFRTIESFLNQAENERNVADGHALRANQLADEADCAGNGTQSASQYRR